MASAATTILVASFVFVMTVGFRSMLNGDAMFYLPQAVRYAEGGGLCNPYYERTLAYSPAHDGRHIWHGFLYQLLLGGALGTDTYPKLALACAMLSTLGALILAGALAGPARGFSSWARVGMHTVILFALSGFLIGLEGRPDTLVFVLAAAAVWVARTGGRLLEGMGIGTIIGLSAVTSPLPALFLGLGVVVWWIVKYGFSRDLLLRGCLSLAAGILAVAFGFAVYPYTLGEWLHGVLAHRAVLHAFAIWSHWRSWLLFSGHFFLGGIVAVGFCSGLILIVHHTRGRLLDRAAAVSLCLLAMVGIIYCSEASGWYVAGGITPVLAALMLHLAQQCRASRRGPARLIFPAAAAAIFCLSAVDPFLLGVARATGWNGMPLTVARKQLEQDLGLPAFNEGRIAFSKSLFVLAERMQGNEVLPYEGYACDGAIHSDRTWAVIQQWDELWREPPIYPGYELVINRYAPVHRPPGRLGQWFQAAGFGYAIYKKNNGAPPER
jgi:hypothetical protein